MSLNIPLPGTEKILKYRKHFWRKSLYLAKTPYIIEKNRANGERDLERLVTSSKVECSWVFSEEDSKWYNIGIGTFRSKATEYGDAEMGVVVLKGNYNLFGKKVSQYHLHPLSLEIESYEQGIRRAKDAGVDKELGADEWDASQKLWRNIYAAAITLPSAGDIESYIKVVPLGEDCQTGLKIASPRRIIATVNFAQPDSIPDDTLEKYDNVLQQTFDEDMAKTLHMNEDPITAIKAATDFVNESMVGLLNLSMQYNSTN